MTQINFRTISSTTKAFIGRQLGQLRSHLHDNDFRAKLKRIVAFSPLVYMATVSELTSKANSEANRESVMGGTALYHTALTPSSLYVNGEKKILLLFQSHVN